jgi:putative ABC transport system permease protein
MLRATLTSLLQRKLRLILSGLAVVLGVMFVSGAFVLTDTLGRSFDHLFATIYTGTDVEVTTQPKVVVSETEGEQVPANLPAATVERVKRVEGVADAYGVAMADGARVIGADGKVVGSAGPPRLGTNWTDKDLQAQLREGRPPRADDQVAMNAGLVKAAGLKLHDRVGILTLERKQTFELVGIFGYPGGRDSLGGSQVVAFSEPVAQRLMLGQPGVFSSIRVTARPGVAPAELRDRIAAGLGAGYVAKTGEQAAAEQSAGLKEFLGFFTKVLLGFAGVALFVGVFLIINTFSITVAQRTRELALIRALGASRRQMVGSVLLEALLIGSVAAVLGLGAGIGAGALLARLVGRLTGDLQVAGLGVPPAAVISAFAVGILVTLAAAVVPALRASRVPPVAALQEVATPDRPLTGLTVTGGLVFAAGATVLALGLRGAGDATLWTILGGVLVTFVGVALLTPLVVRPVAGVVGRLFSWSVPGKLGRLNSGRNPRRTAITAAALMVGVALITGVTTVLSSVTTTFTKLVNEQMQADLIISGDQGGPRPPAFDGAVVDQVAALPGVAAVAGLYQDVAALDGDEKIYVQAVNDLPALRDITGLKTSAGTLDGLAPDQVAVDADTAAEHHLSVGQRITAQFSRGPAHPLTVSGVYASNEMVGQWLVSAAVARDFGIPQPVTAYVQLAPDADAAQVRAQVAGLLADSPEVTVGDRTDFVRQQTSDLDTVLTMIQVLLGLAILIAVLGIINTLALSVLERTRELGLLRAIGLRRGQTMRMVTVEAIVISVFGALLGVAVGAGLGSAVVRALRGEGITELTLPWAPMATYVALAAAVGVLAAALPAVRAARTDVLRAIAYE